jgi:nucleotide-binding universal stress UspA family protein
MRILLPLDFSPEEEVLLKFIEQLSARQAVQVLVVHIQQAPVVPASSAVSTGYYPALLEEMEKGNRNQLDKICNSSFLKNAQVEQVLETDPSKGIPEAIAELAHSWSADLILTCAKHRTNLESFLMGTQLLRIIRNVELPILVLSPGWEGHLSKALLATDLSESAPAAFEQAQNVLRLLNAELHLARINTPGDFLTERAFQTAYGEFKGALMDGKHAEDNIYSARLYNARTPVEGILQCAEDIGADLIVMATYARKGFSLFLNGSQTQEVIEATHLPVLVVRAEND